MQRLVAVAMILVPMAASAKKAPSLPVMEIAAQNGADARLAILATDSAAESLRDLNVFKIISSEDIKKILAFQREKAVTTGQCNEDQCLAEIGGALGADYMVSGKLTKIDKMLKLDLTLFNNGKAKVENAVSQDNIADEKSLVEAAKLLARRVIAPLLEKNSGQLFVAVTDVGAAGATINIDGKTVGTTVPPNVQTAPIPLGWGPHHIILQKEGFLAFEKDVQIDEGQATTLPVTLVPSPDFIDAYKGRNSKLRIGSYITGALTIVAAGAAIYFNEVNLHLYKVYSNCVADQTTGPPSATNHAPNPNVDGCEYLATMEGQANKTNPGDPFVPGNGPNSTLTKAYNDGKTQQLAIYALAGGAIVTAAASVTMFVLSDDPHRYDGFIQANPSGAGSAPTKTAMILDPHVMVAPIPNGFVSSLGFNF